jgi:hypothetical protein
VVKISLHTEMLHKDFPHIALVQSNRSKSVPPFLVCVCFFIVLMKYPTPFRSLQNNDIKMQLHSVPTQITFMRVNIPLNYTVNSY